MSDRDAGRVIAGTARGIGLQAPGPGTRPMGDRVKQTLFAILEPDLAGAVVLDLFAGSGAAGLEALSRGAARVVFVDDDRRATATITANLGRTHLAGEHATVVLGDANDWLRGPRPAELGPFGVVIADPPYAAFELLIVTLVAVEPYLAPGARVVAKHFWRDRPPAVVGLLASERERRFGETTLTFYRRQEGR